jgi:hypothetical protein
MAVSLVPSAVPADLKPWMAPFVKVGYAAKGLIYLLIGTLALRLAFGVDGGRLTDASGVLRIVLRQPFGVILLGIIGVGILTYAVWQLVEGVYDTRRKGGGVRGWIHRSLTMIKGVAYGTVGWEAMRTVLGIRGRSQDADEIAAGVMAFPLGDWFLALVGIGVVVYGGREIWNAWQCRFGDDLDYRRLCREANWAVIIGRAGNGARGILLMTIGLALMRAGLDRRPADAGGIDESLWTLLSQPFGPWILAGVAAGLICFGIFQFMHARYARL